MTAAETPRVDVSRDGGVRTVELAGSNWLNILGSTAIEELTAAFTELGHDGDARVVVLRGAGDRAFIGGADITEMATLDQNTAERFIRGLAELCDAIRACPVPVIARLAGWCLGAGLEVAISCDLRIAESGARFGMPEVGVGIPSVIYAALLPALVGASRTAWLLLTCETIDAGTAADWGLVHEVLAPADLDRRVAELAAKLDGFGPHVLRQQKRLLHRWSEMTHREAIEDSIGEFGRAFLTGEPRQYMQRFLSRKTPG